MSIKRWWQDDYIPENRQAGGNMYNISTSSSGRCKKFNCSQHTYNISFNSVNKTFAQAQQEIEQLFIDLHLKFYNMMGSKDYIRIVFFHDSFDRPVGYPFLSRNELQTTDLQSTFENVIQSYQEITVNSDNSLRASIIIAHMPAGGSGSSLVNRPQFRNQQDYFNYSTGIICVENSDNSCLLKSLLIAIAVENKNNQLVKQLTKRNSKMLHKQALQINKECNIGNYRCGIKELKKYEAYFKYYQIMVIESDYNLTQRPVYVGPPNKKHLYISYTQSHYNVIKSIKRFLGVPYYCHYCKLGYNNLGRHTCKNLCRMCHRVTCQPISGQYPIKCKFCGKFCRDLTCNRFHESKFCYKINKCKDCNSYKLSKHVCKDQKYCKNCKSVVDINHLCYILTEQEKNKKPSDFNGLIFFDYETYQKNGVHVACLVIAEKVCLNCMDSKQCTEKCGVFRFYDNNSFCQWLFDASNYAYTALAHNMQGFDGLFVLKYIKDSMTNLDTMPKVLVNGTKILTLVFRNVRLLDSFSFIPMALSKFPETFDLKELKKGWMCHLFASEENLNYLGPLPHPDYYGSQFFSQSKKQEFEKWYAERSKYLFDYKQELEDYCLSDVKLLKEGCLSFRKIILQITDGIDCFQENITLASLCHLIFRKEHMKSKTIGIIPPLGFNPEQQTSNISLQWLKYLSFSQNINIKHARNGGEMRLGKYRIDGYSETGTTKTLYEFNGCYFHGCPRCFDGSTWNSTKQMLFGTIYKIHRERIQNIKSDYPEYKLIEIWECEFKQQIKDSLDLQSFLQNNCNISDPINARDALFGGRTNSLKLYHKVGPGEKIKYVDFRSLYPDRQKYGIYPIGQPQLITENFGEFSQYFGLIKCKILPPRGLYLPVLPARINGKLYFALCTVCAQQNINSCTHTDAERALTGTWVTLEVAEAIKQGYKILTIYEVWHYAESSQYDKETKSGGLFTSYVDTFMKYKEEASGWPDNVTSDEDKQKHVDQFFDLEGIRLNPDNIKKNPGMRSVMKLILNSLWGKFGMQTNKTQVKFINNIKDWYEMVNNSDIKIHDINMEIPDILTVYYSKTEKSFDGGFSNNHVNVVIASFVTAQARLKLLKVMQQLGERTLYHDTGK
jgi:hypothetical protein